MKLIYYLKIQIHTCLKFYEVFLENNNFYIIMEYAARKDLKSFLSQRNWVEIIR